MCSIFSGICSSVVFHLSFRAGGHLRQRDYTDFPGYKGDLSRVCPLTPSGLSCGVVCFQLLIMPCQKYIACTFASFLPGYLLVTRLSHLSQRKIYAARSSVISWVSEPTFWKGESVPCWLWPQDVKLALAFAGNADSCVATGCTERAYFVFICYQLASFKRKDSVIFFFHESLQTCCLCNPPSRYSLARPYFGAGVLSEGSWPRHRCPLSSPGNQICTFNQIAQNQRKMKSLTHVILPELWREECPLSSVWAGLGLYYFAHSENKIDGCRAG